MDITFYQDIVTNCFFVGTKALDSFNFSIDKEALKNAFINKKKDVLIWDTVIESLKKDKKLYIRDMTYAGNRHSFTAIYSFSNRNKGIIFSISYPLKLIGLRYAKFSLLKSGKYNEELSYEPIDDEFNQHRVIIYDIIFKCFGEFNFFDNKYAENKINDIVIDGMYYEEINLWQVLFSVNNHGIL